MALIYKLVGYDRETEELAVEHVIPEESVEQAKVIAGIWARPEIIADCPLSERSARKIVDLIGIKLARGCNWFLEPSAITPAREYAVNR